MNVDYILILVQKYLDAGSGQDKEIRAEISRAIDSSPSLRNKKDLIEDFVNSIANGDKVEENWIKFVEEKRAAELETLIQEEGLAPDAAREFVKQATREGLVSEAGTGLAAILPPVSRFTSDDVHGLKKRRVLLRLQEYVEKFSGLKV